MIIVLESELEKYAWEVMISAHYKWGKNHARPLRDQLDWYFNDIYKKETEEAVKKEIERQLRYEFGEEFFVSEEEYVKCGLEVDCYKDLDDQQRQQLEQDLREEYKEVQELISEESEYKPDEVWNKLYFIYTKFFISPEKLTVMYNGEIIQGEVKQ